MDSDSASEDGARFATSVACSITFGNTTFVTFLSGKTVPGGTILTKTPIIPDLVFACKCATLIYLAGSPDFGI